jgi:hypothetical protein
LIVAPGPLPRYASQGLHLGAETNAFGTAQVIDGGAQAVTHGAARFASQVLDRGAQAVARGAATLPQQEKINSADVQWNRVKITGFICTCHLRYARALLFCPQHWLLCHLGLY